MDDQTRALIAAASDRLAGGEPHAALQAASAACARAPEIAEAHYVYGQAWLDLGEPGRAEQAFAAAIQRRRDWPDAWINYGLARYRRGAIHDAKTAMRQVLRHAPGHPVATSNLAVFMRLSGEGEDSESLLEAAVSADPSNVSARLNRVGDLLGEGRLAEALALLEDAEPPVGDRLAAGHWLLEKSALLLRLGRLDQAKAELDAYAALGTPPAAQSPLYLWRRIVLATQRGDANAAETLAEQMEQALDAMGPNGLDEHRIGGHFELARFWKKRKDSRRTFHHYTKGHARMALSQPFSREEQQAFFDANIALFDAGRFADGPRAANHDPAPVFIVGMPRSGTTLCEQILAAHAQVHGAGERAALGRRFSQIGGSKATASAVQRVAALCTPRLDQVAERYLVEMKALAPEKRLVVDKMPGNFNFLGLVGLMLPGARIIHCRRDSRDIGLSIFSRRFYGHHSYAHDLGDLGWYIGQHDRIMRHWKATLPNPIIDVHLSDWVDDFDATLARVLAHLDLPHDEGCARFHESDRKVRTASRAQVRQPINDRGLGRWTAYTDELAPLIGALGLK